MDEKFKELIGRLKKATTKEEIIKCKSEVMDLFDSYATNIAGKLPFRTCFDDIKMLYDVELAMTAYYAFPYQQAGFPFLEKHNPKTIEIIQITVLFYTMQIITLLENGYFDKMSLCEYNDINADTLDFCGDIDFCVKYSKTLFQDLFYYLDAVQFDSERAGNYSERVVVVYLAHENECDMLYIDDEKYETMLDTIYSNLSESKYKNIIDGILGIYKMRFTEMQYLLEYQPMFIRVAHKYIYYVKS